MARKIDTLTQSWIRNASDERAAAEGCYFDERAATRVADFFRKFLRHSKGKLAGKPFELLTWQWRDLIGPVFGWKQPDGLRRIRKVYCELPKKNGKSTTCAGIGLYMLIGDGEKGAEVYSAACTKDQAGIVHREAVNMVKASSALTARLRIHGSTHAIHDDKCNSYYKTLASDANTSEGLNPNAIIIDELHAWTGQPGRDFYGALQFGGRARSQPLELIITTAGADTNSVCYESRTFAEKTLAGEVYSQRLHAYIRAADPGDNPSDPATWAKANPSMGETMSIADFKADHDEAKKKPSDWPRFLRYSLNIWTAAGGTAVDPAAWDSCGLDYTAEGLYGKECYAALDLSRKSDFTSLFLLFPQPNGEFWSLAYYWLPEETLRQECDDATRAWADEGFITTTEGNVTDYRFVHRDIVKIFGWFSVRAMGFDPLFAEELTQNIAADTGVERREFTQSTANYAAPCNEFERLVMAGLLRHNRNPVLSWNVKNLAWRTDPSNDKLKRPAKPKQGRKIDGAVAGIMTLALADSSASEASEPDITLVG